MAQKRRGEYNETLQGPTTADGVVSFFSFVVSSSSKAGRVAQAGANANIKGAVEFDERGYAFGTENVRTGWADGEPIPVIRQGIAVVKVGSGGVTKDTYVKSDAAGLAVAYVTPTIGSTFAKAEIEAVRDAHEIIAGMALETKNAGEYCRIDLDRR